MPSTRPVPVVAAGASAGPCGKGTPSKPSCWPELVGLGLEVVPENGAADLELEAAELVDVAAVREALDELFELAPQAASETAPSSASRIGVNRPRTEGNRILPGLVTALITSPPMEEGSALGSGMPMTTALELPGLTIITNLGVCYGLVVRSMGLAGSVGASFKALRRGEISQYTQLLEDSRRHAIDRMVDNARLLDAEAIIAVRFDSSEIGQQFTEIVAYGTAVKVAPAA